MKLALLIALMVGLAAAENWVVIVSGSNTYSNYRHQANICHTYHIMKSRGIPDDHIITMTYDDVPNHTENPFPGKLYNRNDGPDVNEGCQKDYIGDECTPAAFMAVLKGDSAAVGGKKVLKSTKDDKVFIVYTDHGNKGLVSMPEHQALYADELNEALVYMYEHKMYDQLVFYLGACLSGSMFDNGKLRDDMNIYAMTSAHGNENGYAALCPPVGDKVRGKYIGACLSDQFTIAWQDDTKEDSSNSRTFQEQYEFVKSQLTSQAQQFGDLSWTDKKITDFMGRNKSKAPKAVFEELFQFQRHRPDTQTGMPVNEVDAPLVHLYSRVIQNGGERAQLAFMEELNDRLRVDHVFKHFDRSVGTEGQSTKDIDFTCYKQLVNHYIQHCDALTDYSFSKLERLSEACNTNKTVDQLKEALTASCAH